MRAKDADKAFDNTAFVDYEEPLFNCEYYEHENDQNLSAVAAESSQAGTNKYVIFSTQIIINVFIHFPIHFFVSIFKFYNRKIDKKLKIIKCQ